MNKEDIETYYRELEELPMIELPEDASDDAFAGINKALNEVAHISSITTRMAVKLKQAIGRLKKNRGIAKAKYTMKRSDLLAKNKDVKEEKSQGAREARADAMLQEDLVELHKYEALLNDVEVLFETVIQVISHAKIIKEVCGHKLGITQKEMDLGLLDRRG